MHTAPPLARFFFVTLLLVALGALFVQLSPVLTPVFFALLLAYMLDPLVDRLEALRIPRWLGIVILLAVALGFLVVFALLVLPVIVRDLYALGVALYDALLRLLERTIPWLRAQGIPVPETVEDALRDLGGGVVSLGSGALGPVSAVLDAVLGRTATTLRALGTAFMVPIFSFYFLHDFDRIVAGARELLPARLRPRAVSTALEIDAVLGHFMRGQLIVMTILATLYALGFSLVRVPLAVPIGVLAGLLSFIPYVGSGLALVFGLLMSALHYTGLAQLVAVVIVCAGVQLLESFVITPRVVGDKLGLSPVWVLFSLMAFGQLFGFLGVMLALPASAVIKVFVMHALARYRATPLFLGERAPSAVPPFRARLRVRRQRARRRLVRRLASNRARGEDPR